MAYDDRDGGRRRGRGHWRDDERSEWGRETEWRGDQGFGGGWGNQTARPQRLGDRDDRGRPGDDADYIRSERFRGGEPVGYGRDFGGGGGFDYGGPGFDANFSGGPRFDRADVGSTGTHGVHPVSSASSPAYGAGTGGSAREYEILRHDPHYSAWRGRQMAELDRDYDEYRRENQSRFDREFGAWRERRGQQRQAVGKVREHMEVAGSDGSHVGTVDKVRGDRIILTKSDQDSGGMHHSIPCGWIERVDDKVVLDIDAEEAKRRWQDEHRSRALFEREHRGVPGPHVLNRSFAGTYPDEE